MNIIEYVNNIQAEEKNKIVNRLDEIYKKMEGFSCYDKSLRPGKATSYLIYHLNGYYKNILNKSLNTYLEIGTLFGGSLIALVNSGFNKKAIAVDIYTGYYGNFDHKSNRKTYPKDKTHNSETHIQIVRGNVNNVGNCDLQLIKGSSQQESFISSIGNYNIPPLDVLFIDGDHAYKGAYSDYKLFYPYLKLGGLLLLDNHGTCGARGVRQCSNKIVEENKNIECHGVWNNNTWVVTKI